MLFNQQEVVAPTKGYICRSLLILKIDAVFLAMLMMGAVATGVYGML